MTTTNEILNQYLQGKRIKKESFDDLKLVIETIGYQPMVLDWFRFLQTIEIIGWRPRLVTQKLARLLAANKPVRFYSLFCPSYKKGKNAFGFRTDGVGKTTRWGLKTLAKVHRQTVQLGFTCFPPLAIFFDLAIEQPSKVLGNHGLLDLEKNTENLKEHLKPPIQFIKLSEIFPSLVQKIGYQGIKTKPLPVSKKVLERIVLRGKKFYQLFGWTEEQILERSKIIASSEAIVGQYLRKKYPRGIMVYTPTMLERAAVYSGRKLETDPLPIIFPQKGS